MIAIIRLNPDGLFVFSAPIPFFTGKPASFCKVGVHDWVDRQDQFPMLMIQQVAKVFLNFVFENQSGGDFTGSVAGRTNFLGIDSNLRLHSLPGDLH